MRSKIMTTNIYNDDCIKVMPTLKPHSVDLILADLPYANKTTHNEWDILIPFEPLWKNYKRLLKDHGAIILFGQGIFSAQLIMSNPTMYRYSLIWNKVRTTGFLNAHRMPLRQHEDILVFYKHLPIYNSQMTKGKEPSHSRGNKWEQKGKIQDNGKIYGKYQHDYDTPSTKTNLKYPTSILEFPNKVQGNVHPTQKPIELLKYLIKTYTNEGMTVLDNTMGSGSTGVAAKLLNRNFIGIEKEKKYFDIAKERIKQCK